MTTEIPDNEEEWGNRDGYLLRAGYINSRGIQYGVYPEPVYLQIIDDDYDEVGIALTIDKTRELAAHLIVLADTYDAAKPNEPTRAERWAAAPIGTVITSDGKAFINSVDQAYRVKVSNDAWVSSSGQTWREYEYHPNWDIAGTNS